jgi:hypothetical protein
MPGQSTPTQTVPTQTVPTQTVPTQTVPSQPQLPSSGSPSSAGLAPMPQPAVPQAGLQPMPQQQVVPQAVPQQQVPQPAVPQYPPVAQLPPASYPQAPPLAMPGSMPGSLPGAQPAAKTLKIWLTGYSWQDNTPPGSSIVSKPVLHKEAGGTGTYEDPITVAVPGKGGGIWKAGARFYLPTVKRYVIVEDTGASKPPSGQDGHLDMWIGGQGGTKSATDDCMNKITATGVPAILNPPPNMPVMPGPIFSGGSCNVPGRGGPAKP